eukprot:5768880-Amphidinium_carterae.1
MPEKVELMNIDFVCAMARKLHRNMLRSEFHFELSDGSELSGPVSPAWMKGGADSGLPDLQGRVLDLSHAYKQFIASRSSLQFAGLMPLVYNPHSGEAEFFLQRVLPFGSSSSVLAFNRLARALWFAGLRVMKTMFGTYFDDVGQQWRSIEFLLDVLGWQYAKEDKKRRPFASRFNLWGAVVDFEGWSRGSFMVMNNPDRVESLLAMVECLRENVSVSKHEMESLTGKLQFASQFVFGGGLRPALVRLGRCTGPLGEDGIQLLDFIAEWLRSSVPRPVSCEAGQPLQVYTDGACEDEGRQVSCGGLLVDPEGGNEVFGFDIPEWLLTTWRAHAQEATYWASRDIANSGVATYWASRDIANSGVQIVME